MPKKKPKDENQDLINIAFIALSTVLTRMRTGAVALRGVKLKRMKAIEAAVQQIELLGIL